MSGRKRTHKCGELGLDAVGQDVVLMGWVETVRDLGGLIFIDLRDREGVTQILVNPEAGAAVVETAKRIGSEWVIAVGGEVLERTKETVNPNIATGQIEVGASELEVLSEAKTPPFEIEEDSKASEDLRLRYRYLDLRRGSVRRRLEIRSQISFAARRHFQEEGFFRDRNTLPHQVDAGRRAGLPRAEPCPQGLLLCAAAVTTALQATLDDRRDGEVLPDRAVFFETRICGRTASPSSPKLILRCPSSIAKKIFAMVEGLFVDMLEAVDIEVDAPFPAPDL